MKQRKEARNVQETGRKDVAAVRDTNHGQEAVAVIKWGRALMMRLHLR